jgi:hypothetical protein
MASTVLVFREAKIHGYGAEMILRPAAALDAVLRTFSAAVTATRGHGLDWRWLPMTEMPPTCLRFEPAISIALSLHWVYHVRLSDAGFSQVYTLIMS